MYKFLYSKYKHKYLILKQIGGCNIKNMIQNSQILDTKFGYNRLINDEGKNDIIYNLKNNNNVMRIMTYNINSWNNKKQEIIEVIHDIQPDILGLTEFKKIDGIEYLDDNYIKVAGCLAESSFLNIIYFKKTFYDKVDILYTFDKDANLINNSRCATIVKFKIKETGKEIVFDEQTRFSG